MLAHLPRARGRWGRLIAALLFAVTCLGTPTTHSVAEETPTQGRRYEATGYTLAPQFVQFYDKNGGVPMFGYPVSEARMEGGYLVQWTERQRLEWHPEHKGTPHEVLLGLLGRELTRGMAGPAFRAQLAGVTSQSASPELYFAETQKYVGEPFLSYWKANGGLPVFGYPISSLHANDAGLRVQWFERARFEYHPQLVLSNEYRVPSEELLGTEYSVLATGKVLLGHLGLEALRSRGVPYYEFQVHPDPAPESKLRVGLAQGGESDDPAFFDNVRAAGAALGPGLVRLDNIYNHYDVVHRDPGAEGTPGGKISYRWANLDQVIDGVRAMGKEPMICLSYMPETMSTTGQSRVTQPADYNEWADLVRATVTHLNVERKLGIRYWEVWNEPNEIGFWQASYPEYLKLYDVTVRAALSADPTIRIGGPAVSRFSPDHIAEFLEHEAAQGPAGRVDFVSWHSYGASPSETAAQIRKAREIVEQFPQFKPELFITEFNVLQGGPGDSSAHGYSDKVEGAIALMSSLESMQRERLDHALLFELKDGQGPKQFWGRWGILTYDGQPKPIYHALNAYQARPGRPLPVSLRSGSADGKLGMMAFGGPSKASLLLWYGGSGAGNPGGMGNVRVKVALPESFSGLDFTLTLFDARHNNPAASGDATLRPWLKRNAGDLVVEFAPNSLLLIESK